MKKIFLLLLVLNTVQAVAQPGLPEKFGKNISAANLKEKLYVIAGKEMQGRGTGTPGIEKAAAYIENTFRLAGLLPAANGSYQQYYSLYQDSLLEATVNIDGQLFQPGRHFNNTIRQTSNHDIHAHEVVFLGYGIDDPKYSDYTGKDVKGKIVLVVEGEPKQNDTAYFVTGTSRRSNWYFNSSLKHKAAAAHGAAAIFLLQANFPKFDPSRKRTRGVMYPGFSTAEIPGIPLYNVSDSLAMAILGNDQLMQVKDKAKNASAINAVSMGKHITASYKKVQFETKASNVAGLLPGTDLKDEYVVITAHMDHLGMRDTIVYYGADDDGSGTCAVMALAETFSKAKKEGKAPRRSILFMTVSGEEMGLWGSDYYTSNPLVPLEKTTVNLNIDMIGRIGSDYLPSTKDSTKKGEADSLNYVYVIGDDKLSSDLRPVNEAANNRFTNLKLDYRYNDPKDPNRFYYRSDHYHFAKNGVPIIFYFNGVHKDYHRPTDTPDKINYDLYARRAQLVFYTAWDMANRDAMLKRDINLNIPTR
jgi:Zn-dependent M28 family amino/carboxypeptidase